MGVRPPYRDSVAVLKDRVEIIGDALPEVTRNPRHDDEVLGPSIFRMLLEMNPTRPAMANCRGPRELSRCSTHQDDQAACMRRPA